MTLLRSIAISLLLLGMCLTGLACVPQPVPAPPVNKMARVVTPKVEKEMWDAIFMQGEKVGHGCTRIERTITDDGQVQMTTWSTHQVLQLVRFGQSTEQTIDFGWSETHGGVQLFWAKLAGGSMTASMNGEVNQDTLDLTMVTTGRKTTRSIPWEKDNSGCFGVEQSLLKTPMKPGEQRTIKWFQPLLNQIATDELTALAEEDTPLLDGRRRLLKIKSVSRVAGQKIESFLWADAVGNVLRSTVPSLRQETYRTTKAKAQEPATGSFDLGRASVVKVKRELPKHTETRRVVYQATLPASNPVEAFPACLSQQVESLDEHRAKLTVRRITPHDPMQVENIAQPVAADSSPNNLIQSNDENVLKLAKQVAPDETDPWPIALAAEQFVHRKLNKKNFSQGFATAAEVAQHLEGDCTEHAVLLAAICRAKQIPARVAAGLVYYAPEHGFAYHMWNEVWIRDRWVPLDATLAQGHIGGGHLKLFDSNLDGADAFAAFLPVMQVLGQLELEILEVE